MREDGVENVPVSIDCEKYRSRDGLYINGIWVNIKLPSMASLLRTMFNWGLGSQE